MMQPCVPVAREQSLLTLSKSDETSGTPQDAQHSTKDSLTKDKQRITPTLSARKPAETNRSTSNKKKTARVFSTLLRTLLLDCPLMIIFTICMALFWIHHVHNNYLYYQLEATEWTDERAASEMTYYARPCDKEDISTFSEVDLFLPESATAQDAYEHQLRHGFTVFPSVLSEETARNLRQHIDTRNQNLSEAESNFVIAKENRYSYNLGMEEPFVAQAMMEITNNNRFKESAQKILGKNPALIEMTAITSSYGAEDQYWHEDVVARASAIQYARTFGPSYSLFVVLQNTTKNMGATFACPGMHMCAKGAMKRVCEENGFQLVGREGFWKVGDLLLMNMNSWHRGAAHTNPDAPDRVMLILTFVPKPRMHAESRQMSQGITFSLRWDMWGHTWNDLSKASTSMKQPWATLRSLGLYKAPTADWGIDYVSGSSMRMANEDNGFRPDELIDFVYHDGGFKFLPTWLHGEVGDDEETSWHDFLIDTLSRCEDFMIRVSAVAVGGYILIYMFIALVSMASVRDIKAGMYSFGWAMLRLCIIAGAVVALYYAAIKHVDSTQWASDIRHGLRYTSPFGNEESRFDGPTAFPHRNDVLIETRYKSGYLAMYNDFVSNHPGNRVYNELVGEKASTFASYNDLPSEFCVAVSNFIVGALHNEEGRFLYQNSEANFVKISNDDAVAYTTQQLAIRANTILMKVWRELEFLNSEAKYDHLRGSTMMSERHARGFLSELQRRLLMNSLPPSTAVSSVCSSKESSQSSSRGFQPIQSVAPPPLGARFTPARRSVVLNAAKPKESPYTHLEAGKIVEVSYNGRWYKAFAEKVWSTGEVSVAYLGEEDDYEEVHRKLIRAYVPPGVGEMVYAKIGEKYKKGVIVHAKGNGLYNVEFKGEIIEDISDEALSRK